MEMEISTSADILRISAAVVNGGLAGFVGVTIIFPLDLIKTRLQNQPIVDGKKMYTSLFDCITKVFKNEGFRGFYRGYRPNLIGIVPEKAIKLTVNDLLRRHLSANGKITMPNELLAGAGAGFCQVIVTAPMEMFKIYGQDSGRINTLSGEPNAPPKFPVRKVWRKYGIRGFYKGSCATLMRDIPFSMIYFPLFSYLRGGNGDDSPVFLQNLLSGIVAAWVAAITVNPCDVVKTRLQSVLLTSKKYNGIIDCFRRIYREEGMKSFMRGAVPRSFAIGPLFGIAQSVYFLNVGEMVLGIPRSRSV